MSRASRASRANRASWRAFPAVDDFLFDDCRVYLSCPGEAVPAHGNACVDEPEEEEEAGDGTKDNANYRARWGTGIQTLVCGGYGEDLGLAFREED